MNHQSEGLTNRQLFSRICAVSVGVGLLYKSYKYIVHRHQVQQLIVRGLIKKSKINTKILQDMSCLNTETANAITQKTTEKVICILFSVQTQKTLNALLIKT